MSAEEFTQYLHRHIPLTAAVGAQVLRYRPGEIEISAPFAPNINHRGTAFGGSLATLGILSGWAVLHLALREEKMEARLVIQNSSTDFAEPVNEDFIAVSRLPPPDRERFMKTLRRYRRARVTVNTEIRSSGAPAVTHKGTYVALMVETP
jgi:thioesterase domain-containing protein